MGKIVGILPCFQVIYGKLPLSLDYLIGKIVMEMWVGKPLGTAAYMDVEATLQMRP